MCFYFYKIVADKKVINRKIQEKPSFGAASSRCQHGTNHIEVQPFGYGELVIIVKCCYQCTHN